MKFSMEVIYSIHRFLFQILYFDNYKLRDMKAILFISHTFKLYINSALNKNTA